MNPVSPRGTPEWTLKNLNAPQEDWTSHCLLCELSWSVKTTESKYLFLSVQVDLKNDCSCLGQRGLCCVLSCVSLQSMDCSPPGSSAHGILQGRILGCHFLLQGIFPTQGSNPPFLHLLLWQADSLLLRHLGSLCVFIHLSKPTETLRHREWALMSAAAAAKSHQSCPNLYDPRHYSLPGSSVHGILQAKVLEWVAIAFSIMSAKN